MRTEVTAAVAAAATGAFAAAAQGDVTAISPADGAVVQSTGRLPVLSVSCSVNCWMVDVAVARRRQDVDPAWELDC